ncbi:MAG TPA: class I SAM-dependent methyltransferase [Nitrospira sp.]|nr:class I SAM-dependent methyltransferase [Nitrospira sp.]
MPIGRRSHDTTSKAVLQTVAAYERSAHEFLDRWGRRRYRLPALLRQWLSRLPKRARLLDLGCGGGQDAHYLWRQGYRVIGLDRTPALLSFARRRSRTLPLILADMGRLPLRYRSVDGIWAAASLIHLPKAIVRVVLADLLDLTQPGGILAATFTHGTKSRVLSRGWISGRYVARWRKDELERALCSAGWRVVDIRVVLDRSAGGDG